MSLLPGTILFPSMPIGKMDKDGYCIIEMNWWLFLYNLSKNVLGTPGANGSTGLSATALIEIASAEADADDADAIVARLQAQADAVFSQDPDDPVNSDVAKLRADLAAAILFGQDPIDQSSDIAKLRTDVNNALTLAQDILLPDAFPTASGTFVGVLTGFAAGINVNCLWNLVNNTVFLCVDSNAGVDTGTSNATTMTMTGLPAAIQPARAQFGQFGFLVDNGVSANGNGFGISGGTLTFFKGTSNTGASFTAAGTKGIQNACTICYVIN